MSLTVCPSIPYVSPLPKPAPSPYPRYPFLSSTRVPVPVPGVHLVVVRGCFFLVVVTTVLYCTSNLTITISNKLIETETFYCTRCFTCSMMDKTWHLPSGEQLGCRLQERCVPMQLPACLGDLLERLLYRFPFRQYRSLFNLQSPFFSLLTKNTTISLTVEREGSLRLV